MQVYLGVYSTNLWFLLSYLIKSVHKYLIIDSSYQPDAFNGFSGNHQQREHLSFLYDIPDVYVFISLYCCLSVGNKITITNIHFSIFGIHNTVFKLEPSNLYILRTHEVFKHKFCFLPHSNMSGFLCFL